MAAHRELTKDLRALDTGTYIQPSKQTVAEYLTAWLDTTARLSVSPRTLQDYRARITRDVLPDLGSRRLDQLHLDEIQATYSRLQERGLSARTIRYTHSILKQALERAVMAGTLLRNPARYVVLPKRDRKEMSVLTASEVHCLLAATNGEEWHALWAVLLLGGLRPGEALGLKWADLNDSRLVIVRALKKDGRNGYFLGEPKTERSRRTVLLPQQVVSALRRHRTAQAAHILRSGKRYTQQDLIFANSVGGPMDLSKVRRLFKRALAAAGLPLLRLYDTRHTHATLLLSAGENPKVVSERLGHTNVVMTLQTYSHVLPDMQRASVERLESLLVANAM